MEALDTTAYDFRIGGRDRVFEPAPADAAVSRELAAHVAEERSMIVRSRSWHGTSVSAHAPAPDLRRRIAGDRSGDDRHAAVGPVDGDPSFAAPGPVGTDHVVGRTAFPETAADAHRRPVDASRDRAAWTAAREIDDSHPPDGPRR